MRGISENTLIDLHDIALRCKDLMRAQLITDVRHECQELKEPWIPIDENTPKDRRLLLWFPEADPIKKVIGRWSFVHKIFILEYGAFGYPTHYQELPDDPVMPIHKPK